MENWPEFIKKRFAAVPFFRFLDVTVTDTGPGHARLVIPLKADYANTYGITHGGLVAALVDMAAGIALRTLKVHVVTVETTVNYFLPVPLDDRLTVDARLVHQGRKLLHAEIDVVKTDGALVAKGRAIFYSTGEDTGEY